MDKASSDVFRTVEYSRDTWIMRRVPLALLLCLAGTALVVHVAPGPPHLGVLVVFTAMVTAWVVGRMAVMLVFERLGARYRWAMAGLAVVAAIALYALASVVRDWHVPGEIIDYRGRPHPPLNIFGWMIILGASGWLAFALWRHFIPAPAVLKLTTAGICYRAAGLRGLLIPWHEIDGVDGLEVVGPSGYPLRHDDMTTVLVPRPFYEQHILPRRGSLPPPGWDSLFVPKDGSIQVLLPNEWFCIEPRQVRQPVEARWTAFRKAPPDTLPHAGSDSKAPLVYGAWSIDGSLWQALTFLGPLTGFVALLASALHAGGR